jgi:hypothetical protein
MIERLFLEDFRIWLCMFFPDSMKTVMMIPAPMIAVRHFKRNKALMRKILMVKLSILRFFIFI